MYRILWIATAWLTIGFCASAQTPQTATHQAAEYYYTCPMHPEVKSDKPGKCPKCGMTLVKKEKPTTHHHPATQPDEQNPKPVTPASQRTDTTEATQHEQPSPTTQTLPTPGKTVRYDLYISDTTVSYNGHKAKALVVNHQLPAPTLYFTQGDTAEVYVHNTLSRETSIHWHGIILPNEQDGVPYLTTAPIHAHGTHLYKFPIVQNGTYWYHAHTELQEQQGLYGALVLYKKDEKPVNEYTVVFSDWTHERPEEVLRSLKTANDWYGIRKHASQNYGEALVKGHLGTKLKQEWLRQFPMDVSDVYYDAFLTNGKIEEQAPQYKAGDKVRLRIVNGSASTYFWLQYAGGKMSVVAADGNDVQPVEVDRMLIAVAETYDVEVTVPEGMSYEFKATAEDRTKSTSLWLGTGMKMLAPDLPTLKYFAGMKMMNSMMTFNGKMKSMGMQMSNQLMDMNEVMYPEITGPEKATQQNQQPDEHAAHSVPITGERPVTLNYGMLKATRKTTLPQAPTRTMRFRLTGNMNRYEWSINNVALSDTDKILIRKGENVRVILDNVSMMRHPMHLHGHEFRVLNGQGDYAPLKNMLDVMPMEIDTIEFAASYDGDWFFHCHLLYHMMAGMGRVFSYENSQPNLQVDTIKRAWKKFSRDDRMWHLSTVLTAQSQTSGARLMLMNRRNTFDAMGMADYKCNYEAEATFGRYLDHDRFFKPYVGIDVRMLSETQTHHVTADGAIPDTENRQVATLGVQYILPFFLLADLRIDHTGHPRFQLSRHDLAITSRLRAEGMFNTDMEYEVGLSYILTKRFSLSGSYDSHFGPGGGITFRY